MEIKELRIGNLVFRTYWNPAPKNPSHEQDIAEIDLISNQKINVKIKGGTIIKFTTPTFLSHIPLTEEWLLKSGFKKISTQNIWDVYKHDLHEFRIEQSAKKGFYNFRIQTNINNSIFLNCINSVHQLQNLYFALTNNELIYNFDKN